MNDEIKKHMDVLYGELRTWRDEVFPEGAKKEELLNILRNFDKIEEDCYEDFFLEIMKSGDELFCPAMILACYISTSVTKPDVWKSYDFMKNIYFQLENEKEKEKI